MGLSSFFKRNAEPGTEPAAAAAATDSVAEARNRARRRLIGASLLLGLGVVGFPLLFETQPRPVPVDIPIEIPRKDRLPPLVLAPPAGGGASATAPDIASERAADQGREVPPLAAASGDSTAALPGVGVGVAAARPAEARPAATEARPNAATPASAAAAVAVAATASAARPRDDDGARARALLEGKPAAAAESTRVVVQVGAYSDADKLREVRSRVEKLGLVTYTQVVEVNGSRHTRVRVGPFGSRAEADKAAARVRAAGLPAAILTL